MIGAGVFAAFAPAARAAGAGLLIGLALAAAVAYCNATASAQLAAQYPTSGGTYVYGRERLGPLVGLPRRLGLRRRQDRQLRGHGADLRRVRRPGRLATAGRRRRGAGADGGELPRVTRTAGLTRGHRHRRPGWPWPSVVVASLAGGDPDPSRADGLDRRDEQRTASCSRPGCCSSPSPATPGSPPWARRCAIRERTIPRAIPLALGLARRRVRGRGRHPAARPRAGQRSPTRRAPLADGRRRRELGAGRPGRAGRRRDRVARARCSR